MSRRGIAAAVIATLLVASACARTTAPPAADAPQRPAPDLGGQTVMLLPVQRVIPTVTRTARADTAVAPVGLTADELMMLESELAFWLPEQATRVRWVLPDAVERAVSRAPTLEVRVRDLPVRDFQLGNVRTIGDPLYGELRRVSMVSDARLALLPIGAVRIAEIDGGWRVHVVAVLIDTMGGHVLWQGVAAGDAGERNTQESIATAARALAAMLPR